MTGLQSNRLDFEILDTDNGKTIVLLDTSFYYKDPEGPIVEIYLPASDRYFIAPVKPSRINTYDSNTIGLSNVFDSPYPQDLCDGIYTFIYKICPYEFAKVQKYYLRTTFIDRKIEQIYNIIDIAQCETADIQTIKRDLTDIFILLESGKANAKTGRIDKATKDYQLADKKVSRILNKIQK